MRSLAKVIRFSSRYTYTWAASIALGLLGASVARADRQPEFPDVDVPGVTVFESSELNQELELSATALPRESMPQHQGKISFLNSSFMGFELRLRFDTGGTGGDHGRINTEERRTG